MEKSTRGIRRCAWIIWYQWRRCTYQDSKPGNDGFISKETTFRWQTSISFFTSRSVKSKKSKINNIFIIRIANQTVIEQKGLFFLWLVYDLLFNVLDLPRSMWAYITKPSTILTRVSCNVDQELTPGKELTLKLV